MITERELTAAIDKCHAVDNPTADTCRRLADYYIIRDHISQADEGGYSYAAQPTTNGRATIMINSGTEFADAVNGMDIAEIMPVMDELMTVLQAVNPRLYAGVMRKLS